MTEKIKWLAAGLLFLTIGAGMASCSDDDDIDYKDLTLITKMDYDFDDDLLQLCDVRVDYTTFDGVNSSVTLRNSEWEQTLLSTVFPCSSRYRITLIPKENPMLTKPTYDLDFSVEYEAMAHEGTRKYTVVPEREVVVSYAKNVPLSQLQPTLDQLVKDVNALNYNYTFSVDKNGNVQATLDDVSK